MIWTFLKMSEEQQEPPDMFDYSDSDDEADPRSRYALPSQYERAKLQKENGGE